MKICIIHGSPRKGNTYKAVEIFKDEITKNGQAEFKEFFLPKDMPEFCCGCYNCFFKGEDKCPHAKYIKPIEDAIREADGLIFASPSYVLSVSGEMKALLDHLAHIFIPHRPMEEMFSKIAVIISTTVGAGTGHSIKTIKRSLKYWGVKRIYSCGFSMYALNWEDMKKEKQNKISKILQKKADKFYKSVKNRDKLSEPIFTRIVFYMMRGMIKSYEDGNRDKEYWKQKGWLNGKKPY